MRLAWAEQLFNTVRDLTYYHSFQTTQHELTVSGANVVRIWSERNADLITRTQHGVECEMLTAGELPMCG